MFRSLFLLASLAVLGVLGQAVESSSLEELKIADQRQRASSLANAQNNIPYFEWKPPVHSRVQMILAGVVDANDTIKVEPRSAEVFDIDLFNNDRKIIQKLKERGFKVICYFSAGTAENWRPDFKKFGEEHLGRSLPMWPGERWLDSRDPKVLEIMFERIRLAWYKGCDAVDPDNIDVYSNESGGGFSPPLTKEDSIRYMHQLAFVAHMYGLGIGLKNADELLPQVHNVIQFAVNEECMTYNGNCAQYEPLVNPRPDFSYPKPVYHVEYAEHTFLNVSPITRRRRELPTGSLQRRGAAPSWNATFNTHSDADHVQISNTNFGNLTSLELRKKLCVADSPGLGKRLNTVIKSLNLNGWVLYCDGEMTTTATFLANNGHIDAPANYNAATGGINGAPFPSGAVPATRAVAQAQEEEEEVLTENDVLFAPFEPLPAEYAAEEVRINAVIENLEANMVAYENGAAQNEDAVAVYASWRAPKAAAAADLGATPAANASMDGITGSSPVAVSPGARVSAVVDDDKLRRSIRWSG